MMNKLLKYECIAVGRILVPIWAGTAVFSLLTAILSPSNHLFANIMGTPFTSVLENIFALLTVLFFFASLASCVIMNIQRFYKLLGDQGYLMFSLPATAWQHIAAKLLCACGTTVVSILVAIGCVFMASSDSTNAAAQEFAIQFSVLDTLAMVFVALLIVLSVVTAYLYLYLCMAIGSRWPQQRMLASIAAYFVLGSVIQIALVFLIFAAGILVSSLPQNVLDGWAQLILETNPNGMAVAGCLAGAVLLLFVAADAILWIVTQHLITKKLNLP